MKTDLTKLLTEILAEVKWQRQLTQRLLDANTKPRVRRAGGGRKPAFRKSAIISVLSGENPRREGTAVRAMFTRYRNGMSVEEALGKGITRGNLRTDLERGNIAIH